MKEYTLPDFFDYPKFFNVSEYIALFNNLYSYIIKPYDLNNGYSLYIGFRDDYVFMRLADLNSNILKISKEHKVINYSEKLLHIMKSSRQKEACFYFSGIDDPMLVDVMISANKFISPGMLKDVYSKTVPTQEIVKIEIIDDSFKKHSKMFIKPSTFKYVIEKEYFRPLYGVV